jgi:hypothetical protein
MLRVTPRFLVLALAASVLLAAWLVLPRGETPAPISAPGGDSAGENSAAVGEESASSAAEPQPASVGTGTVAAGEAAEAEGYEALLARLRAGDARATHVLLNALRDCEEVPVDPGVIERWSQTARDFPDAHTATELEYRATKARRNFARCAQFSVEQRASYRSVLLEAAQLGNRSALDRLLSLPYRGDTRDPLFPLRRMEAGMPAVELARQRIEQGEPEWLRALADAWRRGSAGRSDMFAEYEALYAYLLTQRPEDPGYDLNQRRLIDIEQHLHPDERRELEQRAEELIARCCRRPEGG